MFYGIIWSRSKSRKRHYKTSKSFMKLESPSFENGGRIHSTYSCEGAGISPALRFVDVPREALTLALTMHDPDVPKTLREDGNWDHWVVWNINPEKDGLREGEIPDAEVGLTTSNTHAYTPLCPPDGSHRYIFNLYALDTKLYLDKDIRRADLEDAMRGHIIAKDELIGYYCKKSLRIE